MSVTALEFYVEQQSSSSFMRISAECLDDHPTRIIIFPNPSLLPSGQTSWWEPVPEDLSFDQRLTSNLQTLSTNDADPDGDIEGLLFVPDINPTDPCFAQTQAILPQHVTRRANLPNTDFNVVGLAPWINANCTKSFLTSARLAPTRALIFYIPDNGTAQPPPIDSPTWDMYDGGAWKSANPFPVYAVPGLAGSQAMTQLSLYSGNLTNVPHGHTLLSIYQNLDPRDYVRVYADISVTAQSSLPALWVFFLIVAGGLFFVLCSTSLLMQYIQRRRRECLRRRIISGQVDLEALGIKRLTVPRVIIDKMPLFVYVCKEDDASRESTISKGSPRRVSSAHDTKANDSLEGSDSTGQSANSVRNATGSLDNDESSIAAHEYIRHSQPTCPICLEDFESGSTTIRELPCGHIFHPECIDNFLSNNSSLCPMCKKSTLPLGYCPEKITNSMVRRERGTRRLRSRVMVTVNEEGQEVDSGWTNQLNNIRSLGRRILNGSGVLNASREGPRPNPNLELRPVPIIQATPALAQQDQGLSRQEIAQQHVQEIPSGLADAEDPEDVEAQRQSRCKRSHDSNSSGQSENGANLDHVGRRAFGKIFPGFK